MGLNTNMEGAARQWNPIDKTLLSETICVQGQLLHNLLVHLVGGKALAILRCVEPGNGYEAWRRICVEYEPATPVRYTSILTGILSPSWTEQRPFAEQLLAWERAIDMYEAASGQRVTDDVRVATMLKYAPAAVKMFLRLTPPEMMESYGRLRDGMLTYLSRTRYFDQEGMAVDIPVPMDVSALQAPALTMPKGKAKGRGKGDSKGQGKGKAKGKQQGPWQPWPGRGCYWCGGRHLDSECRTRGGAFEVCEGPRYQFWIITTWWHCMCQFQFSGGPAKFS